MSTNVQKTDVKDIFSGLAKGILLLFGLFIAACTAFGIFQYNVYWKLYSETFEHKWREGLQDALYYKHDYSEASLITTSAPLVDTSRFPSITEHMLDRLLDGELSAWLWSALGLFLILELTRWAIRSIPKHKPH